VVARRVDFLGGPQRDESSGGEVIPFEPALATG
jgi:hypothetical protein